jgi:hypothetical protein
MPSNIKDYRDPTKAKGRYSSYTPISDKFGIIPAGEKVKKVKYWHKVPTTCLTLTKNGSRDNTPYAVQSSYSECHISPRADLLRQFVPVSFEKILPAKLPSKNHPKLPDQCLWKQTSVNG